MNRLKDTIFDPWFLLGWAEGSSLGFLIGFMVSFGIFLFSGHDHKWLAVVVPAFIGWFVMNACRRYQEAKLGLHSRTRRNTAPPPPPPTRP